MATNINWIDKPQKYRFTVRELDIFDRGFEYGKRLNYRNLNRIKFEWFYDITIEEIRHLFGIDRQAYIHLISA